MTLNGIEIGRRALLAQQYTMDVVGQNIANINTAGYSRQVVNLETTEPTFVAVMNKNKPLASLGSGVKVAQIQRIRDSFLDSQDRSINMEYGRWNQESQNYSLVEGIFNEPSSTGTASQLDKFWNSWQSLASPDPSNAGVRTNVSSQASILAQGLRGTRKQLVDVQYNNNKDIEIKIAQINDIAKQIATLNGQVVSSAASGDANDLKDKRNKLVGDLSKLINVEYYEDSNSSATIAVGGVFLVSDNSTTNLVAQIDTTNKGYFSVKWENSGQQAYIVAGELHGLLQSRDSITTSFIDQLDSIASTLISSLNSQNRAGFTLNGDAGGDFFTGTSASDIDLSSEIKNNPAKIAASSTAINVSGNGENARAMGDIRNNLLFNTKTTSINEYYQNMISGLGTSASEVSTYLDTNDSLSKQIAKQIASTSGVSMDEEMTNMIKSQQAYNAAAKYIQTVTSCMDTLMKVI